jgi:hypothetical protein
MFDISLNPQEPVGLEKYQTWACNSWEIPRATFGKCVCIFGIFIVHETSRHTLKRVPEMMDTPPIQNNCAFIILRVNVNGK